VKNLINTSILSSINASLAFRIHRKSDSKVQHWGI